MRGLYVLLASLAVLVVWSRARDVEPRWLTLAVLTLTITGSLLVVSRRAGILAVGLTFGAAILSAALPSAVASAAQGQLTFLLGWVLLVELTPIAACGVFATWLGILVMSRLSVQGLEGALDALDDVVLVGGVVLAAAALRRIGAETMVTADRTYNAALEASVRAQLSAADENAVRSAHRLLHDEILGALAAVAAHSGADAHRLRSRVADVVAAVGMGIETAAVGRARGGTPLPEVLAGLAATSRLHVALDTGRNAPSWPRLTDAQVGVLRQVVGEALRNVERHAGVASASLSAECAFGSFRVTVDDDGEGFDTAAAPRWGRVHSIEEPMRGIDGSARILSAPGGGARVDITWPCATDGGRRLTRDERAHAATRQTTGRSTSTLLYTLMLLLAAHFYLAVRYSWGDPTAVPQLGIATLVCAVTILALLHLRNAPIRGPVVACSARSGRPRRQPACFWPSQVR